MYRMSRIHCVSGALAVTVVQQRVYSNQRRRGFLVAGGRFHLPQQLHLGHCWGEATRAALRILRNHRAASSLQLRGRRRAGVFCTSSCVLHCRLHFTARVFVHCTCSLHCRVCTVLQAYATLHCVLHFSCFLHCRVRTALWAYATLHGVLHCSCFLHCRVRTALRAYDTPHGVLYCRVRTDLQSVYYTAWCTGLQLFSGLQSVYFTVNVRYTAWCTAPQAC